MIGYNMKKQILYIHGGDSFSQYNNFLADLHTKPLRDPFDVENKQIWVQNFRENMGEDFMVLMPQMPNKQNAKYEEWKIWLERHFEFLQSDIILIGWSLGGVFLAKYLSENVFPVKIKSLYLLAAPSGNFSVTDGNDCGSFLFDMSSLSHLANQVGEIQIWHSEDDFIVPYSEALLYKKHLKTAILTTFKDKNHFLVEDLPELVSSVRG